MSRPNAVLPRSVCKCLLSAGQWGVKESGGRGWRDGVHRKTVGGREKTKTSEGMYKKDEPTNPPTHYPITPTLTWREGCAAWEASASAGLASTALQQDAHTQNYNREPQRQVKRTHPCRVVLGR